MTDALLLVLSYVLFAAGFFWLGWDVRGDVEESRRWKREKEAREREAENRRDASGVVWVPGVGWRGMGLRLEDENEDNSEKETD